MPEFCTCNDWDVCGCGEAPRHCPWCCLDLTPEQLAAFNFDTWEHIPPRPKGMPIQISCGACQVTIDHPSEEQLEYHFSEKHEPRNH